MVKPAESGSKHSRKEKKKKTLIRFVVVLILLQAAATTTAKYIEMSQSKCHFRICMFGSADLEHLDLF